MDWGELMIRCLIVNWYNNNLYLSLIQLRIETE